MGTRMFEQAAPSQGFVGREIRMFEQATPNQDLASKGSTANAAPPAGAERPRALEQDLKSAEPRQGDFAGGRARMDVEEDAAAEEEQGDENHAEASRPAPSAAPSPAPAPAEAPEGSRQKPNYPEPASPAQLEQQEPNYPEPASPAQLEQRLQGFAGDGKNGAGRLAAQPRVKRFLREHGCAQPAGPRGSVEPGNRAVGRKRRQAVLSAQRGQVLGAKSQLCHVVKIGTKAETVISALECRKKRNSGALPLAGSASGGNRTLVAGPGGRLRGGGKKRNSHHLKRRMRRADEMIIWPSMECLELLPVCIWCLKRCGCCQKTRFKAQFRS